MNTVFLRALEADDKAATLRAAIHEPEAARGKLRFELNPASFAAVPRSPFAYWVSDELRGIFIRHPHLQTNYFSVRGAYTTDDFKYFRLCWEVHPHQVALGRDETWSTSSLVPLAKGGSFSPYYADIHLLARWANDGAEPKAFLSAYRERKGWGTDWSACLNGYDHYFRPGLTWPRRTNGLSLRAMPSGCIFADKGPAVFAENDDSDDLLALAAVTNSRAFALLVSLQLARTELAQSYEVGLIQRTPVPNLGPTDRSSLAMLARRAWSMKRSLDIRTETSHAFVLPALLLVEGETLAARATAWAEHVRATDAKLAVIQGEIDNRCFDLYGINENDRAITQGFGGGVDEFDEADDTDTQANADDENDAESNVDAAGLAAELISWAVGVAFGRFDVRLATGSRTLPTEPEPFAPLPRCSPAMLTGDDGLPLRRSPGEYPVTIPENGILVHDPGLGRDLAAAARAVFDEVFVESADTRWNEAATLLDPKDHDLRAWLATRFFEYHLKRHSKSRRKAPILWQLGVPSGRYSVWIYADRITRDSFFQIQNDVVTPKLLHEERQLTSLMRSAGANPSAKERREIASQESLVEELRAMLDEVKRVAPLWNPALDDGVALTMAPLWRLVQQHKPWQKELKGKWGELASGKYDWAHIAMHLWPDRVVPSCASDRSLAIGHGLEDVFWMEGDDGKWKPRPEPTRPVDELVRERNSVAVKAALKGLSEASVPNGSKTRTRRSSS